MLLKYFNKKKKVSDILFVSFLLPYFLLCITIGGLHEGIFTDKHCNHAQQSGSKSPGTTDDLQEGILKDASQHDSETCQICQWLKTPSTSLQLLIHDSHFDCICVKHVCSSNPVIPSLSIHKFTIRPPPSIPGFLS